MAAPDFRLARLSKIPTEVFRMVQPDRTSKSRGATEWRSDHCRISFTRRNDGA
jgi:hypothetical protein